MRRAIRFLVGALCLAATSAVPAEYYDRELIRLLTLAKSEAAADRLDAAQGLGISVYPPAASEALVALLGDPQWFVRSAAADSLGSRADANTVVALKRSLTTETDSRARQHLAGAIDLITRGSAYKLFALSDPDPEVRLKAAKDAAFYLPGADPKLIALLDDPVPEVRVAAAESLVARRNPAVVDYQIRALASSGDGARRQAIQAIGQLKAAAGVDPLLRIVAKPNDVLWSSAVAALGDIGDPRAAQPIVDAMSYLTSGSWYTVAVALGKFGDDGVDALIGALKRPDEMARYDAQRCLGVIKSRRATSALIPMLNDPSDTIRGGAAGALRDIADPASAKPLEDALQSRSGRSNAAIVVALGAVEGTRAVPTLVRQLARASSLDESTAILRMLGELGGPEALDAVIRVIEGSFVSSWKFQDSDRRYAAEAAGSIGGDRASAVLYGALARRDLPVVQGAVRYYIAIGRDGSDALLAKALDPSDKWLGQTAEVYAASGNPTLVSAASAWGAAQHTTVAPTSYRPVRWKQGAVPR